MHIDTWTIREDGFLPETAKMFEGVFTLGNGYMHSRGSMEELLEGEAQNRSFDPQSNRSTPVAEPIVKAGTYVPGLMGKPRNSRRQMVNLPFFFDLSLQAGEESLDMRNSQVRRYLRTLDMRQAVLIRSLSWYPRFGGQVDVQYERFISAARKHLAVQRITLRSKDDTRITICGGIDGEVTTVDCDLFSDVAFTQQLPNRLTCNVTTNLNESVQIRADMHGPNVEWQFSKVGRHGRLSGEVLLPAGQTIVLEKRIALTTSRDQNPTTPDVVLEKASALLYEDLLAEHIEVWEDRWELSDVQIDGDDVSQRNLRHSLYHLHRALVRGDDRVAIGAKGYAGELYHGLFFWDTEMFLLPFYLYTSPEEARCLCDYRIQALDGAKRVAKQYGYSGARFPWMADPDGDECCEPWLFKDLQVHATADVIYGLSHWAAAAGCPEYLSTAAAETVLETGRYWLERVDRRGGDERAHLVGIMGPDEFTPMLSNNSYTNRMVRFSLELAAAIGSVAGASGSEICNWIDIAQSLPMPRREDGLVLQAEGFDFLADIDIDALWKDRSIPFDWQVPRERIHRSKVLKQADVLMLMLLFPHEYSDAEVQAAWDYYMPMTAHDSSLSPGIHAMIAIRLGYMGLAMEFWNRTVGLDLRAGHGGAREGIHIACCGASWMIAVLGFGGMRTALQSDTFRLDPHLPSAWKRLCFPIVWKQQSLYVEITSEQVTIHNRSDKEITVDIAGRQSCIASRQREVFPCVSQVMS